jgi:hypothetical protein
MKIENKVRAIRDKEPVGTIQAYIGCQKLHRGANSEFITLCLQCIKLGEKRRNVYYNT